MSIKNKLPLQKTVFWHSSGNPYLKKYLTDGRQQFSIILLKKKPQSFFNSTEIKSTRSGKIWFYYYPDHWSERNSLTKIQTSPQTWRTIKSHISHASSHFKDQVINTHWLGLRIKSSILKKSGRSCKWICYSCYRTN
jgi:hypothetical protein